MIAKLEMKYKIAPAAKPATAAVATTSVFGALTPTAAGVPQRRRMLRAVVRGRVPSGTDGASSALGGAAAATKSAAAAVPMQPGEWHRFEPSVSAALFAALLAGETQLEIAFTPSGQSARTAVTTHTALLRQMVLRRHADDALLQLEVQGHPDPAITPRHWVPILEDSTPRLCDVARDSAEFKWAEASLQLRSPNATMIAVQRVQDVDLWQRYAGQLDWRKRENGGDPNERWLFHGTGGTAPSKIWREGEIGFDSRLSSDGYFGRGGYFSESSHYSDKAYSYCKTCSGSRHNCSCGSSAVCQMFLASVACGRSKDYGTSRDSSLKRPPVLESDATKLYHSVNSTTAGDHYRMWVVYSPEQAYPRYVLTYRSDPNATSAHETSAVAKVALSELGCDIALVQAALPPPPPLLEPWFGASAEQVAQEERRSADSAARLAEAAADAAKREEEMLAVVAKADADAAARLFKTQLVAVEEDRLAAVAKADADAVSARSFLLACSGMGSVAWQPLPIRVANKKAPRQPMTYLYMGSQCRDASTSALEVRCHRYITGGGSPPPIVGAAPAVAIAAAAPANVVPAFAAAAPSAFGAAATSSTFGTAPAFAAATSVASFGAAPAVPSDAAVQLGAISFGASTKAVPATSGSSPFGGGDDTTVAAAALFGALSFGAAMRTATSVAATSTALHASPGFGDAATKAAAPTLSANPPAAPPAFVFKAPTPGFGATAGGSVGAGAPAAPAAAAFSFNGTATARSAGGTAAPFGASTFASASSALSATFSPQVLVAASVSGDIPAAAAADGGGASPGASPPRGAGAMDAQIFEYLTQSTSSPKFETVAARSEADPSFVAKWAAHEAACNADLSATLTAVPPPVDGFSSDDDATPDATK